MQTRPSPEFNYLGLDSHIPQPERDSVHLAIGDARCSFEHAATPPGGAASFHAWTDSVLPNPFSEGVNITTAILYNSNYLTLIGGDSIAVSQGVPYADAGTATPDGATIASNATDLDTSNLGTYKIHYNATKGCGLLDTAVRTVEVRVTTMPVFASATLDESTRMLTITFVETIDISAADPAKLYVSDAGTSGVSLRGAAFDQGASDSNTISLTLRQSQLRDILDMNSPQLDIRAGAVASISGDEIDAASGNPITVERTPNKPPVAPNTPASTAANTPVTITPAISDPDGDNVRISAVANPPNGAAAFTGTTITYTPDQGFAGTDSFRYTVDDGQNTAQGTITVTVKSDAEPPRIVAASVNQDERTLTITFSEVVDVSEINLAMLYVRGEGYSSRVGLSDATILTTGDSNSILIDLTDGRLNSINSLPNPSIEIDAGAVTDLARNEIPADSSRLAGAILPDLGRTGDVLEQQRQPIATGGGGGGGSRGGGGGGGGGGGAAAPAEFAGLYSVMWDCNEPATTVILDSNLAAEITLIAGSESFTPVPDAAQNLDGRTAYTADAFADIMLLKVSAGGGASTSKTINTLGQCTGQTEYDRYVPGALSPIQAASAQPVEAQTPAEHGSAPAPVPITEQPDVLEPVPAAEQDPAAESPVPAEPDADSASSEAPAADDGGCLIATAAYGTELAPQVQMLRELRDSTLLSTDSGASFVSGFNSLYYEFSPGIADMQRENPAFRDAVRALIAPMLYSLSVMSLADENSEASVLALGILVIALNLGMYAAAPAAAIVLARKHWMAGASPSSMQHA